MRWLWDALERKVILLFRWMKVDWQMDKRWLIKIVCVIEVLKCSLTSIHMTGKPRGENCMVTGRWLWDC